MHVFNTLFNSCKHVLCVVYAIYCVVRGQNKFPLKVILTIIILMGDLPKNFDC